MNITGIIAEYNPFHLGHAYHLNCVRESGADAVLAVMSGNYTERGEAAIADKFVRARAAVKGGADVVIELPAVWSVSCAERFASAGVKLLDAAGCVNSISFGSECGDINLLNRCVDVMNSSEYDSSVKAFLNSGCSYPKAMSLAMNGFDEKLTRLLENPNDTLGLEYIKAVRSFAPDIGVLPVKRIGARHDTVNEAEPIKAASDIRTQLLLNNDASQWLPDGAREVLLSALSRGEIIDTEKYSLTVLSKLKTLSSDDFLRLPEVSEGLENRLFDSVKRAVTLNEACELAKTKRYTMARIRRIFTYAYLGITEEMQRESPGYIRVLAASSRGGEVLSELTYKSKLPVILRFSDSRGLDSRSAKVYNTECIATDLYSLCLCKPLPSGRDMTAFLEKP